MIQFGESALRLASIARQAGHSAAAINELWPLIWRLKTRAADGCASRVAMRQLGRARALLVVALGDVLPEEKLASSARWTGRALRIAQHLADPGLLCHALRVHGNELRKTGRGTAAAGRLQHASGIAAGAERGPALIQLACAAADLGNALLIERYVTGLDGSPISAVAALGVASPGPDRASPADLARYVRGQWAIENCSADCTYE